MLKIVDVAVHLVTTDAVVPAFRWRDGLPGSDGPMTGGWLALTTDEGDVGWAYCRTGAILQNIVDRVLAVELLSADPMDRERLWHKLWELDRIEYFPLYVQGVVDVALWDLAGKITE